MDKTKNADISYNNVCKYIIKTQISVPTMFANMASQKVQEMVILAEQGNGLFRPLIFSLLSFQFYILFSVLMQIWYLPCFNVIFFFSIDVNTSGSEIEEMKMNFFSTYTGIKALQDPVPKSTKQYQLLMTQYHQLLTSVAIYLPSIIKYQLL